MPVEVTAFIPIVQRKEIERVLNPLTYRRIEASAINDGARFGRTQVSRTIRAEINIKAKDVNALIKLERATVTKPFARITIRREPSPMKIFAARQTKKGVTVKTRKKEPRELLRGAFIVASLGGHVFRRKGKERLPITKLYGPTGVGVLAGKPGMLRAVTQIIHQKFMERMDSKIAAHLEGAAFGALGEKAEAAIGERMARA